VPAPPLNTDGSTDLLAAIKQRPQFILSPLFAVLFFGDWEYACRASRTVTGTGRFRAWWPVLIGAVARFQFVVFYGP
jgi:hypothetical protein